VPDAVVAFDVVRRLVVVTELERLVVIGPLVRAVGAPAASWSKV
jgi:hypothetical protein